MTEQNAVEFINNIGETTDTIIHISHNDLDGYGASYIASQHLSNCNLVQCNINYGRLIEALANFKIDNRTKIIITDINLTLSECNQLNALTKNWIVVDHHATGQKSSERYHDNYYLDTSYAATKLIFNILSESKFNSESSLFNISELVDTFDVWRKENDILFKQGILITDYINKSPFEDSELKLKYINWIFEDIVPYLFKHGVQKCEIRFQDMFLSWLSTMSDDDFMKDEYLPTNVKCALMHVDIIDNYIVYKTNEYIIFSGISTKITQYVFDELFKNSNYSDKVLINLNKRNGNTAFRSVNGKASELAKLCMGGGHPNAAGAKINVDDGEKYLDNIIIKLLKR